MSRFPGDIAEVLADCAALRSARAAGLGQIRNSVQSLRTELAGLLERYGAHRGQQRAAGIRNAEALRQALDDARQALSQTVAEQRTRNHAQRIQRAEDTAARIQRSRQQTRQRVQELRTLTRSAQAARFRDGSFQAGSSEAPRPVQAPARAAVARVTTGVDHAVGSVAAALAASPLVRARVRQPAGDSDTGFDSDS